MLVHAVLAPSALGTGLRSFTVGRGRGDITNPYSAPLASDATIYGVHLNPHGQVVGGASEEARAQVQPGATVAFSQPDVEIGNATTLEASVDPCVAVSFSMPGDCPATG